MYSLSISPLAHWSQIFSGFVLWLLHIRHREQYDSPLLNIFLTIQWCYIPDLSVSSVLVIVSVFRLPTQPLSSHWNVLNYGNLFSQTLWETCTASYLEFEEHPNRFDTPTWGTSEASLNIHCGLCGKKLSLFTGLLLYILSEVHRVQETLSFLIHISATKREWNR